MRTRMYLAIKVGLVLALCAGLSLACAEPKATGTPAAQPPTQAAAASPTSSTPAGAVRRAEFAGSWYPGDPAELARTVDEFLGEAEPLEGTPVVLIVPHAGYVFSGPVAGAGFRQLKRGHYDTAVIIASDHQLPLSNPIAVWPEGSFQTPLGLVPVNAELAQKLIAAEGRIKADLGAFAGEHTIEIELPFLQRVCPACRIVPVLMGTDKEEDIQALSEALLKVLPPEGAVIIISSDLSHYPTYEDALVIDKATLSAIQTGDPQRLRQTIAETMHKGYQNLATCACGETPILVGMRVAQGLGASQIAILSYQNSGDRPQGSRSQVVGYGAVMFCRPPEQGLTPAQRQELLALARTTITEYLKTKRIPDYQTDDPVLNAHAGAFVTLKKEGQLRGCIGRLMADAPLYRTVQEMAVASATSDPRFRPLTLKELEKVSLEISVLSQIYPITDVEQIEVGRHGLLIVANGHQGVLLPQVAVEEGWGREEFLQNLCLKAGLARDCWTKKASLYAFTATVFGE